MRTDVELRLAISEEVGWTHLDDVLELLPDRRHWLPPHKAGSWDSRDLTYLPDYPNDLNAMHAAELTLSDSDGLIPQREQYRGQLMHVTKGSLNKCVHATARQRAEAFVAVMENK